MRLVNFSPCQRNLIKTFKNEAQITLGHLICTLISENQGLEKLRSVSNLRKISGPTPLWYKSEKNSGDKLKKNSGVQELKFF